MERLTAKKVVHLPDLFFVRFCEEKFGVNRGVYNTIDTWFYEKGVMDILRRRRYILRFLNRYGRKREQGNGMKFGHVRSRKEDDAADCFDRF